MGCGSSSSLHVVSGTKQSDFSERAYFNSQEEGQHTIQQTEPLAAINQQGRGQTVTDVNNVPLPNSKTIIDPKPSPDKVKSPQKHYDLIDASKFTTISLDEVPNLKPETPQEMWAIVKGTTAAEGLEVTPTKNRKGWRTIRIFVSSTFKDFHHEREVLVKEVFPDLRIWCEQRKLRLVECDLRWGVPKDTTTEETIKICLGELDRCYEDNVAPFFLNLAGDRSGWIPDFGDLTYNLAAQYGWVYGLSVTEMEIVHGAFRKLNPNALFMIRESEDLDTLPETKMHDFIDSDPRLLEKIHTLKQVIKASFPASRVITYKAKCVPQKDGEIEFEGVGGEGDCGFSSSVYKFFKERIAELYPLDPSPEDPLEVQRDEHETFMHSRGVHVYGRDEILKEVKAYYTCGKTMLPLRIVGVAGAGKSAIMAKSALDAVVAVQKREIPSLSGYVGWKVFYHFVGATPGSTDLAFFLQRLTKELKPDSKDVLSDLDSLVQLSFSLLSNPYTEPAIIFIDAINQLDEDKQHFLTRWLPEELSPNVRVIVSTIEDTTSHNMLKQNKKIAPEVLCGPLDLDSREKIVKNYLVQYNKRLDKDQMATLLSKKGSSNPLWLTLACEELRVFGQFDKLLDKIESLPDDLISLEEDMFSRFEEDGGGQLMVAALCMLEVSRHGLIETELLALLGDETNLQPPEFKENDTQTDIEEAALRAAADAVELEKGAVEELADRFSKLTDDTYMVRGEDLPKRDKEHKAERVRKVVTFLPARYWAQIYRNLKPLLRPCGNLGGGRLDFYHRSLSKAVRKKYFSGSEDYVRHVYLFWHGILASYFEEIDDMDRKAEELPYHLENLMDNSRLVRCLLEWPIFNRLFSPDFSVDLIRFWQRGGGYSVAAALYKESLDVLKGSGIDLKEYADQQEKVIAFLSQCGQHNDALELLQTRLKIEKDVLKERPEKMATVYQLMAACKSEISKAQNYISASQLPDEKEIVSLCKQSLAYRKTLSGKENRFEEAVTNVLLCFHLCSVLDVQEDEMYRTQAREAINNAIQVFEEIKDLGHLADCMMTATFVNPRGDMSFFPENEEKLLKALDLSRKAYGEKHLLTSRIYLNTGIMYEEAFKLQQAYDFFKLHYDSCMELYGPSHPRTKKATATMQEPRYARIKANREKSNEQPK